MRTIDKKLNIIKANLLNEERYLNEKNGINEGWKTNVAAGLASLAGGMGANAQSQQAPKQNQSTSIQYQQPQKQDDGKTSNDFNTPRTLPIVHIQTGVTDGKTGKDGVYVYHKLPSDPTFNVKKDREMVYNDNLSLLRNTIEYQEYMRNKQSSINEDNIGSFTSTHIINKHQWEDFKNFSRVIEKWNPGDKVVSLYYGNELVGTYDPRISRLDYNKDSILAKKAQEFDWKNF